MIPNVRTAVPRPPTSAHRDISTDTNANHAPTAVNNNIAGSSKNYPHATQSTTRADGAMSHYGRGQSSEPISTEDLESIRSSLILAPIDGARAMLPVPESPSQIFVTEATEGVNGQGRSGDTRSRQTVGRGGGQTGSDSQRRNTLPEGRSQSLASGPSTGVPATASGHRLTASPTMISTCTTTLAPTLSMRNALLGAPTRSPEQNDVDGTAIAPQHGHCDQCPPLVASRRVSPMSDSATLSVSPTASSPATPQARSSNALLPDQRQLLHITHPSAAQATGMQQLQPRSSIPSVASAQHQTAHLSAAAQHPQVTQHQPNFIQNAQGQYLMYRNPPMRHAIIPQHPQQQPLQWHYQHRRSSSSQQLPHTSTTSPVCTSPGVQQDFGRPHAGPIPSQQLSPLGSTGAGALPFGQTRAGLPTLTPPPYSQMGQQRHNQHKQDQHQQQLLARYYEDLRMRSAPGSSQHQSPQYQLHPLPGPATQSRLTGHVRQVDSVSSAGGGVASMHLAQQPPQVPLPVNSAEMMRLQQHQQYFLQRQRARHMQPQQQSPSGQQSFSLPRTAALPGAPVASAVYPVYEAAPGASQYLLSASSRHATPTVSMPGVPTHGQPPVVMELPQHPAPLAPRPVTNASPHPTSRGEAQEVGNFAAHRTVPRGGAPRERETAPMNLDLTVDVPAAPGTPALDTLCSATTSEVAATEEMEPNRAPESAIPASAPLQSDSPPRENAKLAKQDAGVQTEGIPPRDSRGFSQEDVTRTIQQLVPSISRIRSGTRLRPQDIVLQLGLQIMELWVLSQTALKNYRILTKQEFTLDTFAELAKTEFKEVDISKYKAIEWKKNVPKALDPVIEELVRAFVPLMGGQKTGSKDEDKRKGSESLDGDAESGLGDRNATAMEVDAPDTVDHVSTAAGAESNVVDTVQKGNPARPENSGEATIESGDQRPNQNITEQPSLPEEAEQGQKTPELSGSSSRPLRQSRGLHSTSKPNGVVNSQSLPTLSVHGSDTCGSISAPSGEKESRSSSVTRPGPSSGIRSKMLRQKGVVRRMDWDIDNLE